MYLLATGLCRFRVFGFGESSSNTKAQKPRHTTDVLHPAPFLA